jgi:protein-S-isoprenylcysteine O-methyltransferase Ste14
MCAISIIQNAIAFAGSLFLLYVSMKTLLLIKSHGFCRFFVFEACLLVITLNLTFWIKNPFSIQQVISWILLILSIYLVYQSYHSLKKTGGRKEREKESATFSFENTANLVSEGIYKYIRHPMYGSFLFLSVGAFLKHISVFSIALTVIAILFLILTAKTEENEDIKFFGNPYLEYIKKTKMFIPFLF